MVADCTFLGQKGAELVVGGHIQVHLDSTDAWAELVGGHIQLHLDSTDVWAEPEPIFESHQGAEPVEGAEPRLSGLEV